MKGNLNWKKVDKTYIAKNGEMVFRLNWQNIGVYSLGQCYALQARRIGDVKYEYLGYTFVTKDDSHNAVKKYSVNQRLWSENDMEMIIQQAEMLLEENVYIS